MKKIINKKLWIIGLLIPMFFSCNDDVGTTSVVQGFEPYSIMLSSAVTTILEQDTVLSINFVAGSNQNTPATVSVAVGSSSTAVEDVDFEIVTSSVDLEAFGGQDGFMIEVKVLQDFTIEGADETIYLTLSDNNSGSVLSETLLITIQDSRILPLLEVDFTLRWEFTDPTVTTDICSVINDLDFIIVPLGSPVDAYSLELLTGTNTLSSMMDCPETGTLMAIAMTDGVVYDVNILIFAPANFDNTFNHLGLTVFVDFERPATTLNGTIAIPGVFNASQTGSGRTLLTIERNGQVITIKNKFSGMVLAEG